MFSTVLIFQILLSFLFFFVSSEEDKLGVYDYFFRKDVFEIYEVVTQNETEKPWMEYRNEISICSGEKKKVGLVKSPPVLSRNNLTHYL